MYRLKLMLMFAFIFSFVTPFVIAELDEGESSEEFVVEEEREITEEEAEKRERPRKEEVRRGRKAEMKERHRRMQPQRMRQMQEVLRNRRNAVQSGHLPLDFDFHFPLDKLTADQRRKIQIMHLKLEQTRIRKESEIRAKAIDLRIEMLKLVSDRQTVEAIVKEIGQLQTEIQLAKVGTMFEAFGVLTPDQLSEARERFSKKLKGRPTHR